MSQPTDLEAVRRARWAADRVTPATWGNWLLSEKPGQVAIVHEPTGRALRLGGSITAADIVTWIVQLQRQGWADDADLGTFTNAMDDLLVLSWLAAGRVRGEAWMRRRHRQLLREQLARRREIEARA